MLWATKFRDGERIYYCVRSLAYLGEIDRAIEGFERLIDYEFFCYPAFASDPWLDSLRGLPRFTALMRTAERRHKAAAFAQHGGARLLNLKGY